MKPPVQAEQAPEEFGVEVEEQLEAIMHVLHGQSQKQKEIASQLSSAKSTRKFINSEISSAKYFR